MAYSNSNQKVVPEAREALDKFKYEVASEVGVNLKQGYNGDLSSRDAGRIGGQMVRKSNKLKAKWNSFCVGLCRAININSILYLNICS